MYSAFGLPRKWDGAMRTLGLRLIRFTLPVLSSVCARTRFCFLRETTRESEPAPRSSDRFLEALPLHLETGKGPPVPSLCFAAQLLLGFLSLRIFQYFFLRELRVLNVHDDRVGVTVS